MRSLIIAVALAFLFVGAAISDDTQRVTYWISESAADTTGWTLQGHALDLPVYLGSRTEQSPGVLRVAVNAVILEADTLRRPLKREARYDFGFDYPDSTSAQSIGQPLPDLGTVSLQFLDSYLLANQIHLMRAQLGLADSLYLKRTVQDSGGVAGVTTTVASWPLP